MSELPMVPTDFEFRRRLAALNPDAFEALRRRAIDEVIARAPPERQERLRALQWRIDQAVRHAATPLAGCIALSDMMWESVLGRGGLLEALQFFPQERRSKATIIPFIRANLP